MSPWQHTRNIIQPTRSFHSGSMPIQFQRRTLPKRVLQLMRYVSACEWNGLDSEEARCLPITVCITTSMNKLHIFHHRHTNADDCWPEENRIACMPLILEYRVLRATRGSTTSQSMPVAMYWIAEKGEFPQTPRHPHNGTAGQAVVLACRCLLGCCCEANNRLARHFQLFGRYRG